MKIIIPIAGKGSRFLAASDKNPLYKIPKPLIPIFGKPMVWWALHSLPFVDLPDQPATTEYIVKPKDVVFIVLDEHEKQYKITHVLKNLFGKQINVIPIPQITQGAAESALFAKEYMTEEDLIILDCDNYFDGATLYKTILNRSKETAGIIPVFIPTDKNPKWSYTLSDTNHHALAVGEKDPELAKKGAKANVGAYYFSKGSLFRKEAKEMIARSEMYGPKGKQEFYIAPLYQKIIEKGMKIKTVTIPQIWNLGTPEDLEFFLNTYTI